MIEERTNKFAFSGATTVFCSQDFPPSSVVTPPTIEDNVNHPLHYNSSRAHCECGRKIECIDVTRHMNFNIGNVVKYLWRFAHKNGLEDLKKARWYLDDQIKQMEKKV
jgi:hypothetical protein